MATTAIPRDVDETPRQPAGRQQRISPFRRALAPFASLRLTVTLMGMAIFIILAGTLAQAEVGTETAVNDYFRVRPWGPTLGFAWIPFQVLLPEAFFPNPLLDARPTVPGGFWFPGGWLIGCVMLVNLLSAHAARFSVQGKGWSILGGLALLAAGGGITAAVISSGMGVDGMKADPLLSWDLLWGVFQGQVLLAAAFNIGLAVWLYRRGARDRRYFWVAVAALPITIGLTLWAFFAPQVSDASMRILWQLIKASMAALVLLAGCWLIFRKRAGIVLLHSGVALLMVSELLTGMYAQETRIALGEGETQAWGIRLDQVELAVVDPSNPEYNVLTRFPEKMLEPGKTLSHESVPFKIRIDKYFPNASRAMPAQGEQAGLIDSGTAAGKFVKGLPEATGVELDKGVDQPAMYVTLFSKESGDRIGSYLVSVGRAGLGIVETVPVNGTDWKMSFRFWRDYKPYSVTLLDVNSDSYVGTSTAMNYSSTVRIASSELGVDFERKIWMNNPLRFAGETLYQSGYFKLPNGSERTVLQVVRNTGWMLPYVACMIVVIGMLSQFLITLSRFLFRRSEMGDPLHSDAVAGPTSSREQAVWKRWAIPGLVVLVFAGYLAGKFMPPQPEAGEFNLTAFGELPVASHGRVKPLDTLARNALKALSNNRQEYEVDGEKKPAIQWLLELIAKPQVGMNRRVIRIDNGTLLSILELPGPDARQSHQYSIAELTEPERLQAIESRTDQAREKSEAEETLSAVDRAALQLEQKIGVVFVLLRSFDQDRLESFQRNFRELLPGDIENPVNLVKLFSVYVRSRAKDYHVFKNGDATQVPPIPSRNPPLVVWYQDTLLNDNEEKQGESEWETLAHARLDAHLSHSIASQTGETDEINPAVAAWSDIFDSYAAGDATAFNAAVSRYAELVQQQEPQGYQVDKVVFEAYFNHAAPFYYLMTPYVFAALLACFSWMGFTRTLNRTALCLIVLTFLLHTLALAGRIYISGRPPVTNLYSSAIFIGWAAVAFGIALELFFRFGFGSVLAGVMGFASLLIAHNLSSDGTDTFSVLVAVLDTQFWLATHVVCITLGYTATYVAGFLGLLYIILGTTTRKLGHQWGEGNRRQSLGQTLIRMIYGVLCFALLFSFFGTVLGGLWADDSWGRFWGWDPKENGALMIVLWNALVLHARWGKLVKDKGLAVLVVLGNIVVSWSWFGTNELGVGLHSYGFTEGVLLALGLFVLSQLIIAGAGCLPKSRWMSFRQRPATD